MMDRLLEICALDGTSGDEGAVRDYIKSSIHADKVITDNLGNLLVFKKGRKTPKNRIMFAAHMDEVGFMVTDITSDGFLRFGAVGGIDPRVVLGRAVRFGNGTRGVIGTKAVHQQSADERKKAPDFDALLIDIGAENAEEAGKRVSRGDCAVFDSDSFRFGSGFVKSKAIDDRARLPYNDGHDKRRARVRRVVCVHGSGGSRDPWSKGGCVHDRAGYRGSPRDNDRLRYRGDLRC